MPIVNGEAVRERLLTFTMTDDDRLVLLLMTRAVMVKIGAHDYHLVSPERMRLLERVLDGALPEGER